MSQMAYIHELFAQFGEQDIDNERTNPARQYGGHYRHTTTITTTITTQIAYWSSIEGHMHTAHIHNRIDVTNMALGEFAYDEKHQSVSVLSPLWFCSKLMSNRADTSTDRNIDRNDRINN